MRLSTHSLFALLGAVLVCVSCASTPPAEDHTVTGAEKGLTPLAPPTAAAVPHRAAHPAAAMPGPTLRSILPSPSVAPATPPPATMPALPAPPADWAERIAPSNVPPDAASPQPAPIQGPPLTDILFDFDSSILRPDAVATLKDNVQWLHAHSALPLMVEGHCDERGSREYNLALGQRRAVAAADYLTKSGIDARSLRALSYGKELPFALGHDEISWQLNRRAHFRLSDELARRTPEANAVHVVSPPTQGGPAPR